MKNIIYVLVIMFTACQDYPTNCTCDGVKRNCKICEGLDKLKRLDERYQDTAKIRPLTKQDLITIDSLANTIINEE